MHSVRASRARSVTALGMACVGLTIASPAEAVVTMDYVHVGNAANAPDAQTGRGAVSYGYHISKYEVTNSQYAEFLNAKAKSDPLGLFDPNPVLPGLAGITRGGTSGNFSYAVKPGYENTPVVYVDWYSAVRFTNWLHNGQGNGSTESGAYTLLGNSAVPSNGMSIVRSPGAAVFIPTHDEWYKAAFYDPNKPGGAGYWDYPTRTDAEPYSDNPPGTDAPTPSNTVNFKKDDFTANGYNDGFARSGSSAHDPNQLYLTDVGAYVQSLSPYGTFDQGGNVHEWTETLTATDSGGRRVVRGGSYVESSFSLGSHYFIELSSDFGDSFGFRVASVVPEPATPLAAAAAAALGLALRRRDRGTARPSPS